MLSLDASDLRTEVSRRSWYHTIELAPSVVTPGWFDTRTVAGRVPMPRSLGGKRCLDVGTFDGFWAFEMERRGAASVLAIDVVDSAQWDWPYGSHDEVRRALEERKGTGDGFDLVRSCLDSKVERRMLSVYDLDPKDVGRFDFVYVGSLLLHLRDPIRALERVRSVCCGQLLVVDAVDLELSVRMGSRPVAGLDGLSRPWWWKPSLAGLRRMIVAAGFEPLTRTRLIFMPPGRDQPVPPLRPRLLATAEGRAATVTRLRGEPHGAVLARPR